jgi:hypothetical protein
MDHPDVIAAPAAPRGLQNWVHEHDQRWSFVLAYLGLAVVLSVLVSLFWLVMVAGIHFLLECIRQALLRRGRTPDVVAHALWEVKLDIGLVLLALTLAVYVDVVFGLLGLQSAARAGAVARAGVRLGSRAAAWERNLRTFLLTVDEMVRLGYGFLMVKRGARKGRRPEKPVLESETALRPWTYRWRISDKIAMALITVAALMLVAAPFVTANGFSGTLTLLLSQLRPFPG